MFLIRVVTFATMRALELKVPPVAVAGVCAALMWMTARYWPGLMIGGVIRIAAIAILAFGGFFAVTGVLSFKRANTTVNPVNIDKASVLVTTGVYRYSRNPMYVGILCLLLAWGFLLSSLNAVLASAAFVLYINRFQIQPEEAFLVAKFGEQYKAYRTRVRRWL